MSAFTCKIQKAAMKACSKKSVRDNTFWNVAETYAHLNENQKAHQN